MMSPLGDSSAKMRLHAKPSAARRYVRKTALAWTEETMGGVRRRISFGNYEFAAQPLSDMVIMLPRR